MTPTRVLFLTGSLRLGGTERNILHLATRLDRERFRVEVWSDYEGEPLQEELRARGIVCHSLKGRPSIGAPALVRLLRHNLPYQWRLFRLFRKRRGAVVHALGFPMIYYAVIWAWLAGNRRIFFAVQDWDVWKRSGIYRLLDRLCSRLARRVIADGEGARQLAVQREGMDDRRMVTIYDGVNTQELRPLRPREETLRQLGLDPARPVVGMIARLDIAKKGQDLFLAALPRLAEQFPAAQFLIVGDGPDRAKVETLVAALPPAAQPVLAGFRMDLADMLGALDILVIPSRWESVPKILLEGMWLGRAVVAARTGDIAEILDDSCGTLVPAEDPMALAEAILALLRDETRRDALGRAAHERIASRGLTLEGSVARYETIYLGW